MYASVCVCVCTLFPHVFEVSVCMCVRPFMPFLGRVFRAQTKRNRGSANEPVPVDGSVIKPRVVAVIANEVNSVKGLHYSP